MSMENIFIILFFVVIVFIILSPFEISGQESEKEEKNEAIRKKRT